jgi:hypothetical protein
MIEIGYHSVKQESDKFRFIELAAICAIAGRWRKPKHEPEPLVSTRFVGSSQETKTYFSKTGDCEGYKSRILRFTNVETVLFSVHEHRNTPLSVPLLLPYSNNRNHINCILNSAAH